MRGVGDGDSTDIDRLRPYVERARAFSGWNLDRVTAERLGTRDGLVLTESRFLIEARKPT